jgi:hypothetical protein
MKKKGKSRLKLEGVVVGEGGQVEDESTLEQSGSSES